MDDSSFDPRLPATGDDLSAEIHRLREANEDLRASALWWLRLYEAAVRRRGKSNGRDVPEGLS